MVGIAGVVVGDCWGGGGIAGVVVGDCWGGGRGLLGWW